MRILRITSQHRRDFTAVLICEHCEHKQNMKGGYDDDHFHQNVIPKIKCDNCNKVSSEDYRPQPTKYAAHEIV